MRQRIRRFVDWVETGPAWQTVWFLPFIYALYIYARIVNSFKKDPS